jgi:DUF1365 family protein
MISALYDCRVTHERREPRRRFFAYRIFYLWIDLDELDEVGRRSPLLTVDREGFCSFRQEDHWPTGNGSLKERVVNHFADRGVEIPPDASVRLLALPRCLGYSFNPIRFYFLTDGPRVIAAAAEVENTFRERKFYLLPPDAVQADGSIRLRLPKEYYVSPFIDLDVDFEFDFRLPGDSLDLSVNDLRDDDVVFLSRLTGQRRELDTATLLRLMITSPLGSLRVIALIHWQALLLWLRGHRWFPKAARPERQRDVIRPHKSLLQTST